MAVAAVTLFCQTLTLSLALTSGVRTLGGGITNVLKLYVGEKAEFEEI